MPSSDRLALARPTFPSPDPKHASPGRIRFVPEWLCRRGADKGLQREWWGRVYYRVPKHPPADCLDDCFLPMAPETGRLSSAVSSPPPGYAFYFDYVEPADPMGRLRVGFAGQGPEEDGPVLVLSHQVVYGETWEVERYAEALGLRPWRLSVSPAALTPVAVAGFAESVRHMCLKPPQKKKLEAAYIHSVVNSRDWEEAVTELLFACRTLAQALPGLPHVTAASNRAEHAREIADHLHCFETYEPKDPSRAKLLVTRATATYLAIADSNSQRAGMPALLRDLVRTDDAIEVAAAALGEARRCIEAGDVSPPRPFCESPSPSGRPMAEVPTVSVAPPPSPDAETSVPAEVLATLSKGERKLVERLAQAGIEGVPVNTLADELHPRAKNPTKTLYSSRGRAEAKLKGFVIDAAPAGCLSLRRT